MKRHDQVGGEPKRDLTRDEEPVSHAELVQAFVSRGNFRDLTNEQLSNLHSAVLKTAEVGANKMLGEISDRIKKMIEIIPGAKIHKIYEAKRASGEFGITFDIDPIQGLTEPQELKVYSDFVNTLRQDFPMIIVKFENPRWFAFTISNKVEVH